jgi:membrane protease YdiL (CAAX protease family)
MAVLVVVEPLLGVWMHRRLVRRLEAGEANARASLYLRGMLMQWTSMTALVAIWLSAGRPAAALGFVLPEGVRLLVGAIITLLVLAFLYWQWRAVRKLDDRGLAALRAQMAPFADFLPRTNGESALFRGVSVSAGVCEEIGGRGYTIWYLAALVGQWPAVVVGAALFGIGHLYQGRAGMMKTGVTGLLLGILYVGTGSLLYPMILHAAVDLHGNALALHATRGIPASARPRPLA